MKHTKHTKHTTKHTKHTKRGLTNVSITSKGRLLQYPPSTNSTELSSPAGIGGSSPNTDIEPRKYRHKGPTSCTSHRRSVTLVVTQKNRIHKSSIWAFPKQVFNNSLKLLPLK